MSLDQLSVTQIPELREQARRAYSEFEDLAKTYVGMSTDSDDIDSEDSDVIWELRFAQSHLEEARVCFEEALRCIKSARGRVPQGRTLNPPAPEQSEPKVEVPSKTRDVTYAGVKLVDNLDDTWDPSKLGLLPVTDQFSHHMYLTHVAAIWSAEELRFNIDAEQYAKMPASYKTYYRKIVGFFQVADAFVSAQVQGFEPQNIAEEAFLATQAYMEIQHQHAYSLAATNVIMDQQELYEVRDEARKAACVRDKFSFIVRHRASDKSLGHRYLAGAFAEGVFFAALFAMVFLFRAKNLLRAFCDANTWIMRDETLHRDFNCEMAKRYAGFTVEEAHAMAREACDVEIAHARHLLSEPFDSPEADAAMGLTLTALESYARALTDQVLTLAGIPPLFKEGKVELPWMLVGVTNKENFYEGVVTAYTQMSVTDAMQRSEGGEAAAAAANDVAMAIENPEDVDV